MKPTLPAMFAAATLASGAAVALVNGMSPQSIAVRRVGLSKLGA